MNTVTELLPSRARYGSGDPVTIEVVGVAGPATATLFRLGEPVATLEWPGTGLIDFGAIAPGGYGVELEAGGRVLRTAVEVSDDARARLRYGFVASYLPGRDPAGLERTVRRLHLSGVQFYDWAYRHADLRGGGEEYRDALDQPISLETVRQLIRSVQHAGSRALGYAAVYAVGPGEWSRWQHDGLLTASGPAYGLGDFLFLLDPAAPDWLEHFTDELAGASAALGFDGYHLDQYGYPKRARRADGEVVDLAESFPALIEGVRAALPEAHLVFNNVNDFPTWSTAATPQDAVYIEPWQPSDTLGALAHVVDRTRSLACGKPVVLAAYQHVYDSAPAWSADLATSLTMATLYSHGATQLLAGEDDRILVDPYYVRNHAVETSTSDLLARWYDFVVEHDALLLDPGIVDVTAATTGQYNDDYEVSYAGLPVSGEALAGAVWRRVTERGSNRVLHLINLTGQSDTLWDAPRERPGETGPGTLRMRRVAGTVPRVRVADPDGGPRLTDVPVVVDGDHAMAELPPLRVWQLVLVDSVPRSNTDEERPS